MNVAKQPKTGTYNEDNAIYKYGQQFIQKLNFCSRALPVHSLKVLCGETFFFISSDTILHSYKLQIFFLTIN